MKKSPQELGDDNKGLSTTELPIATEEQEATEFDPRLIEVIRQEAHSISYAIIESEYHSGPMPSPKQLADYEKILPGLATEIRDEFLRNGRHVREMESKAMEYAKDDNDKNRRVAERLVWVSLTFSVVLALTGHDWVAGVIAASTVGAVITGFLNKRARAKKEQDNANPE